MSSSRCSIAVDHQQPIGMFEDGHVAADLTDATEGDRAEATLG
jgi:hypothetical protein